MNVNATARVQILVEVTESSWGGTCSIDQLYEQASRMAVGSVTRMIGVKGKIIGEPKVIGIVTERA